MLITKKDLIAEIIAGDYRTAAAFEQFGIDFCCNGNCSIEDGCSQSAIDPDKVVTAVQQLLNTVPAGSYMDPGYKSWPLDLLIDLIEKKHHRYVTLQIPVIKNYLEKITTVHGDKHPELFGIKLLFGSCAAELAAHMKKEELLVFPHIRQMLQVTQTGDAAINAPFNSVQHVLKIMMHEHDTEGKRFKEIASLSSGYLAPEDACNTYRITLALLKEFEDDLHLHIHIENNIIFPGAIALESSLVS